MRNLKSTTRIRRRFLLLLILSFFHQSFSQGYNHTWLLGYYPQQYLKGRLNFTATSAVLDTEYRAMPFLSATQGNISDINGNFLMSSNGLFIANANNDTMFNGDSLNPNSFTNSYPNGLPIPNGNIFLPYPNDTNKFILFHETGNFNNPPMNSPTEIYYSLIDITLNSGLGAVTSKNNIALTGTFGAGMGACKHGNGRDWWIIAMSESGDISYRFLLTPDTIQYMGDQNLQVPAYPGFAAQPTFSPDGSKFSYVHSTPFPPTQYISNMRLFDFDRCDGTFSNPLVLNFPDSNLGVGTAFSPDSKKLYSSSTLNIYQFNVDSALTTNPSLINIAVNDSFADPQPPFYTLFYLMYLAANGKIYLTTGNGTQYLHVIENPDSMGIASDVQQHSVFLPFQNGQSVPVHPNYYLGRKIGSPCDTLTSINDLSEHNFSFSISPNPTNGNFKIIYLLPQNKPGVLEIFDLTGKEVYKQNLPQWSTLQYVSLPKLSNGVYICSITSNQLQVNKKFVVFYE